MKKNLITVLALLLTAILLLSVTNTTAQVEKAGEVVFIPDANLAAALREALGLPPGTAIMSDALRNLTRLDAKGRGIADLTGLEYAVNLTRLDLSRIWIDNELHHNPISNLSSLATLTNLEWLSLGGTGVSDVSALASLTNLKWLSLNDTFVSDVSALASLTNLMELDLRDTAVSDVSALASLTNLRSLSLSRTGVSDVSALASLTNLERLSLGGTGVSDVSALATLTNLRRLSLLSTGVSDVSALATLTNLETLHLWRTGVSDVSALASLTNLVELNLIGCPLNAAAHQTHIPAIQLNGTQVKFEPFKPIHLQRVPWLVSLIYFRPSDRPVRPNVDAEIDALIKKAQRFFADQLELHGFGRKTFQFETDAQGNAVVHHVEGKFPNVHYQQNRYSWEGEIHEQIYIPRRHITVHMLDSAPGTVFTGAAGTGGGGDSGGVVNIDLWGWRTLAHELAHAFGLQHDWRPDAKAKRIQAFTSDSMLTSFCAAEWLSVHPAFNPGQPVSTSNTTIKRHPPTLASPPNTIRLRFEVTDLDGLHQAQLQIPDFVVNSGQYVHMVDCKQLKERHSTVEFVTTALTPRIESVRLHVIDVRGHISYESFPIDVVSLLPPAKVVSIPDPNLAAAVRESLNMSSGEPLTTHFIHGLAGLRADNAGIKDFTGLEHAVNLKLLHLRENDAIWDLAQLASLTNLETLSLGGTGVSDVSALASLTNLERLDLFDTAVSDVSALATLTNLERLNLRGPGVSDVSTLAGLTNLKWLSLGGTGVSDVSALATLTNLKWLSLGGTGVSDVSALATLTNLEGLDLRHTGVSDVSALAGLTNLEGLDLRHTGVSDVSTLAGLTNLVELSLHSTGVSDVSALATLTNLRSLSLSRTGVSDVSALATLTNLEWLHLWGTGVSDVSALAGLTNLEWLSLNYTAVSDVSPLLGLSLPRTYSAGSFGLHLGGCPLSYASIHTHIPALQAKEIEVEFDNVAHPALLKSSGDRQEGAGATALPNPFVVEAMDEHGEPMVGRTVQFDILGSGGTLSAKTVTTDAQGKARVSLTLGNSQGVNKVRASSEGIQSWVLFTAVGTGAAPQLVADVNGDGVTDLADLAIVAQAMGKPVENPRADVNGDGVVDGEDFALVAAHLGEGEAAAPSQAALPAGLTLEKVEWALNLLHAENTGSPAFRRGIAKLEGILALLVPDKTVLLANYPNPFNPETWIPYQLSKPAEVTVTIYAANGAVVRMLDLGHRRAGSYESRHRAAYWDGRNAQGESVASGVYFYTLSAGDFKATRKMVIRK